MENEMNSENWSQPNENQPPAGPQPEKKPFFQQEWLQKTWLSVKLATWIKCFIVAFVLSAVAVFIAPEFTTAQYQPQDSQSSEYEEDVYGNCESEGGRLGDSLAVRRRHRPRSHFPILSSAESPRFLRPGSISLPLAVTRRSYRLDSPVFH